MNTKLAKREKVVLAMVGVGFLIPMAFFIVVNTPLGESIFEGGNATMFTFYTLQADALNCAIATVIATVNLLRLFWDRVGLSGWLRYASTLGGGVLAAYLAKVTFVMGWLVLFAAAGTDAMNPAVSTIITELMSH